MHRFGRPDTLLASAHGGLLRAGETVASGSQLDIVLRWEWAGRSEVPDGVRVGVSVLVGASERTDVWVVS